MKAPKYTVIIQWSDEDQVYVVSLPEWGSGCKTHGDTYEDAARNVREVLELLIETHKIDEEGPLPQPKVFSYPGADVVNLPLDELDREALEEVRNERSDSVVGKH